MIEIPATTVLGGALVLTSDGWRWRDGEPEPRVSTLRLRDLAPHYRCITYGGGQTYVEVPHRWQRDVTDPDVRAALRELVRDRGRPADIFAEGAAVALDDHRVTQRGYLVPIEAWDAVMSEPCGSSWPREIEPELLEPGETTVDSGDEKEDEPMRGTVQDVPFAAATNVTEIEYRLAPIDVGFDLRRQACVIGVCRGDDPIRVSYADVEGERRVISGPQRAVLARLRKLGYSFVAR